MTTADNWKDDPLALQPAGRQWKVTVGGLDVSSALRGGDTSNAMNQLPTALINLDTSSTVIELLDFCGEVVVSDDRTEQPVFAGHVVTANVVEDKLQLSCEGGVPGMRSRVVGHNYSRVPAEELVYALMINAGLESENILMPDNTITEVFEVIAPIAGISVIEQTAVGNVHFVNAPSIVNTIAKLVDNKESQAFLANSVFAVTYATGRRVLDAEVAGTDRIDDALSWLNVVSRDSSARQVRRPIRDRSWTRDSLLFSSRRLPDVFVRGLISGRTWLRDSTVHHDRGKLFQIHTDQIPTGDPFSHADSEQFRQAARALHRACNNTDPVERIGALWDAVEFYAGNTRPPALFADSALKPVKQFIKREMNEALTDEQRQRLLEVIGGANNPPLLAKWRHQLALDGVIVTTHEMSLMGRLRKLRNYASHGRAAEAGSDAEISHGIAIVARALSTATSIRRQRANRSSTY